MCARMSSLWYGGGESGHQRFVFDRMLQLSSAFEGALAAGLRGISQNDYINPLSGAWVLLRRAIVSQAQPPRRARHGPPHRLGERRRSAFLETCTPAGTTCTNISNQVTTLVISRTRKPVDWRQVDRGSTRAQNLKHLHASLCCHLSPPLNIEIQ